MPIFNLTVNNKLMKVDVSEETPLLWVLREHLDLVGTKYGCGIAQCGACTVHINGVATRSCVLPISSVGSSNITTIEGLSETANHAVQEAWNELDVPQCGYCQAGQIMSAASLLASNSNPNDEEIETAMQGNLCRCATYHRIHQAIKLASTKLKN
jgi:isoquinoline 1-oxidoreductase subunit alpha